MAISLEQGTLDNKQLTNRWTSHPLAESWVKGSVEVRDVSTGTLCLHWHKKYQLESIHPQLQCSKCWGNRLPQHLLSFKLYVLNASTQLITAYPWTVPSETAIVFTVCFICSSLLKGTLFMWGTAYLFCSKNTVVQSINYYWLKYADAAMRQRVSLKHHRDLRKATGLVVCD